MKDADGNEIRVEFAPGAFDYFEGTQEELDAFQKEIMEHIANMTAEDLAEASVEVDDVYIEQLMEEDPEQAQALIQALTQDPAARKLQ
jgi:uncharacterized alkaline shock family protein YloU